jgi:hypothetical protein
MRNLKRAFRFAPLVALLACISFDSGSYASAQQRSSVSIVGRWRPLEASKSGMGVVLEFRSDGTFDSSLGVVLETQWRIDGNQLMLLSDTEGGAERKVNLKWLGDNKLSLEGDGGVLELARIGDRPDAGNPIIGEWTGHREIDGRNLEVRYLFYLGGKLLLLMPGVTQHGSYTITGSALQLKRMSGAKSKLRIVLTDNLLTLSEAKGGHEDRYARY